VGLIEEIPTVTELIDRMVTEALDLDRNMLSENKGAWQQKSSA